MTEGQKKNRNCGGSAHLSRVDEGRSMEIPRNGLKSDGNFLESSAQERTQQEPLYGRRIGA